jgi:hypothetical protein
MLYFAVEAYTLARNLLGLLLFFEAYHYPVDARMCYLARPDVPGRDGIGDPSGD